MSSGNGKVYLDNVNFDDPHGMSTSYEVGIDDKHGLVVYSECCASAMSDDIAGKVYEALGRYLADRHYTT
ncbi:MAG: hypothetical protein ABW046_20510 [Actinoplanes sp.]